MEPVKQGAGEHILRGRHVIGLLFLMTLLSAVFFTLGYVLGRNQYDDHVYAASNHIPNEPTPPSSYWEFDDYLKVPPERAVSPKTTPAAAPNQKSATSPPLLSNRSYLQVGAFVKESEALALENNLRKKRFPAFVLWPCGETFYCVLVGPYSDQKAAEAARKGLKKVGFAAKRN